MFTIREEILEIVDNWIIKKTNLVKTLIQKDLQSVFSKQIKSFEDV